MSPNSQIAYLAILKEIGIFVNEHKSHRQASGYRYGITPSKWLSYMTNIFTSTNKFQ
uniref:Uncharacterized protein n=1 Tax=Arundo donax TaxID=35708 RepID=A0A0A8YG35_ARUDO